MEKRSVEILYKTKGDFSPNGLQKVFCSFHPADISHMENVVDDILSVANCVIFYHLSNIDKDVVKFRRLCYKAPGNEAVSGNSI